MSRAGQTAAPVELSCSSRKKRKSTGFREYAVEFSSLGSLGPLTFRSPIPHCRRGWSHAYPLCAARITWHLLGAGHHDIKYRLSFQPIRNSEEWLKTRGRISHVLKIQAKGITEYLPHGYEKWQNTQKWFYYLILEALFLYEHPAFHCLMFEMQYTCCSSIKKTIVKNAVWKSKKSKSCLKYKCKIMLTSSLLVIFFFFLLRPNLIHFSSFFDLTDFTFLLIGCKWLPMHRSHARWLIYNEETICLSLIISLAQKNGTEQQIQ